MTHHFRRSHPFHCLAIIAVAVACGLPLSGQESKSVRILFGHSDTVFCVAFSPDGKTIASCSQDKTTKLWDVATGKITKTFDGHASTVLSLAFSPDGKTVAEGHTSKTITLWDLNTGKNTALGDQAAHGVWSVAFNLDGKLLASGGNDSGVRLWELASGNPPAVLGTHGNDTVRSVVFSRDGNTLA